MNESAGTAGHLSQEQHNWGERHNSPLLMADILAKEKMNPLSTMEREFNIVLNVRT